MRLIILFIVTIISGCTTSNMWNSSSYSEQTIKITGFYVNKEKTALLVSSLDGGYFFPIDKQFAEVLLLTHEIHFLPEFTDFSMNLDKSKIVGKLTLHLSDNVNANKVKKLQALGVNFNNGKLKFSRKLKGKYYLINKDLKLEKMRSSYSITVLTQRGFSNFEKVAFTPATAVADVLVAPIIVFIWIPIVFITGYQ